MTEDRETELLSEPVKFEIGDEPTLEQQARQMKRVQRFTDMTNAQKRQHIKKLRKRAKNCPLTAMHLEECLIVVYVRNQRAEQVKQARNGENITRAKAAQAVRESKARHLFKAKTEGANLADRLKG